MAFCLNKFTIRRGGGVTYKRNTVELHYKYSIQIIIIIIIITSIISKLEWIIKRVSLPGATNDPDEAC